jgi:hypothetical protein
MAETVFDGPLITVGDFAGQQSTAEEQNPLSGPNISYQGECFPDPRWLINKDKVEPGTIFSHQMGPVVMMLDQIPAPSTTASIVAAAATSSGTAMTLISSGSSANYGVSYGVPFYPFQGSTVVTGTALDFGFCIVATTAASKTVTPVNMPIDYFYVGQQLVIAHVGNAAGTKALITTVTAVGATTITIADNALLTSTATKCGNANIPFQRFGNPTSTAASPYLAAGAAAILNPQEALARTIAVTCSSSATTCGTFTIAGYDIYGSSMSELIALTSATSSTFTVYGKKAFKFVTSVTPNFASSAGGGTGQFSVGVGEAFGFPIRNDKWEYLTVFYNGAQVTATSTGQGYTAADTTATASSSTTDTRGTIQVSSNGNSTAAYMSSTVVSSTTRLTVMAIIPPYQMAGVSPPVGTSVNSLLYGVTQF